MSSIARYFGVVRLLVFFTCVLVCDAGLLDFILQLKGGYEQDGEVPRGIIQFPTLDEMTEEERAQNRQRARKVATIIEKSIHMLANDILQVWAVAQVDHNGEEDTDENDDEETEVKKEEDNGEKDTDDKDDKETEVKKEAQEPEEEPNGEGEVRETQNKDLEVKLNIDDGEASSQKEDEIESTNMPEHENGQRNENDTTKELNLPPGGSEGTGEKEYKATEGEESKALMLEDIKPPDKKENNSKIQDEEDKTVKVLGIAPKSLKKTEEKSSRIIEKTSLSPEDAKSPGESEGDRSLGEEDKTLKELPSADSEDLIRAEEKGAEVSLPEETVVSKKIGFKSLEAKGGNKSQGSGGSVPGLKSSTNVLGTEEGGSEGAEEGGSEVAERNESKISNPDGSELSEEIRDSKIQVVEYRRKGLGSDSETSLNIEDKGAQTEKEGKTTKGSEADLVDGVRDTNEKRAREEKTETKKTQIVKSTDAKDKRSLSSTVGFAQNTHTLGTDNYYLQKIQTTKPTGGQRRKYVTFNSKESVPD